MPSIRSVTKYVTASVLVNLDEWSDEEIREEAESRGFNVSDNDHVIDDLETAIRNNNVYAVFDIARRYVCDVKGIVL